MAVPGLFSGAVFSVVLGFAGRRRRFDELSLPRDLRDLGYGDVAELSEADPEEMYVRLQHMRGGHQDRCVLYVFRCAVYFASSTDPDPELLKWWAWKDRPSSPESTE